MVGAGVGGTLNLPVLLVLVGGLSAFLMRQPATAWLRIRRGRGRRADGPLAAGWALGLALVALLSLMGLMALGLKSLLWLLFPLLPVFAAYLALARSGRAHTRTLWMEMGGAAGLAAMAPAAYVAATGELDTVAWILWGVMAAQNTLGVLYVRLRISYMRGKEMDQRPVLWGHVLVLVALAAARAWYTLPWLVLVPFAGFLLRAAWAVKEPRPIGNIKRFGFTEVGVEVLSGLWIVFSYLAIGS